MKTNKKIIAMNICIVLILLFSAIYVAATGNHYTLHTRAMTDAVNINPKVEVNFTSEGILEMEDYRIENEELLIDFKAVGQGKTGMTLHWQFFDDSSMMEHYMKYTFSVNFLNVIFENTNGNFNFNGYDIVIIAILTSLLITEIIMIFLFNNYRKQGNFCYQMIACGGIGIYIMIILLYITYKMLNNVVNSFTNFLVLVTETGIMLLLALVPIMLLISLLLAISNIWLMRNEGYRPVNALGIIFAVLWAVGVIFTIGAYNLARLLNLETYNITIIKDIITYIVVYIECMFLSTIVCSYLSTRYKPHYDRDYIIILGCGIRKDGTLTPLLKGRADSAIAFEKAQYEKNGKHAVFVPSGGQGSDEIISEGEAIERYLLSQGIPAERICREDKSTNTFENMQFSRKVIEKHGGSIENKNIAFATTNYHIFRGYILSKKNGFDAKGISAKTKFYFYPNAFLREFIGLLVDQKWKHIIFMFIVILFFVGLKFWI